MSRRTQAVLALALLAGGFLAGLLAMPWSDERVNDLFVYRTFTDPLLSGALPYRDVFFEYPPLAAPAIVVPGLLAGTEEEAFRLAFAAWTFVLAAAVVLLCGALAARSGGNRGRALLAAALMPLLCGALLRTHFDLAPVAILLAGLLLLVIERPRAGLALLGVGAMTKVFPLAAVPVAIAWLVGRGRGREAWQGALACAAAMVVLGVGALALSPSGATGAVEYHLERPVQVESLPALGLLALDQAGLGEARSVSSHRSDGLEHPAAGILSVAILAALAAVLTWLCTAQQRRSGPQSEQAGAEPRRLLLGALAAVTAFAVLGRVLSPQFVIWILPLGALALAWRMYALSAAVAASALLTLAEFPSRYFDVVAREPGAIALVAARNLALLLVLGLALRALLPQRQQKLADARGPAVAVRLDQHGV